MIGLAQQLQKIEGIRPLKDPSATKNLAYNEPPRVWRTMFACGLAHSTEKSELLWIWHSKYNQPNPGHRLRILLDSQEI